MVDNTAIQRDRDTSAECSGHLHVVSDRQEQPVNRDFLLKAVNQCGAPWSRRSRSFSDRTMVIADGRLIACGSSPDVITSDLLREIYHVEARIEPCSRGLGHVIVDGAVDERRTVIVSAAETESGIRGRFEATAVPAA